MDIGQEGAHVGALRPPGSGRTGADRHGQCHCDGARHQRHLHLLAAAAGLSLLGAGLAVGKALKKGRKTDKRKTDEKEES